jgi:hypothetical protein
MLKSWKLFIIGFVAIFVGASLAHFIQTFGGTRVRDVRFVASNGVVMSALLYQPANATAKTPAPGILAVHGYIARNAGRLCDRICAARLCRAGSGSARPRL